jgi:hypothetical protein
MRVITILLRHGTDKYADSEDRLNELFQTQMAEIQRRIIVVDTLLPEEYVDASNPDRIVIGGDNSFSEWSAADCAIRYLGPQIWSFDLVNFVTLAFNTLYTKYLGRFDKHVLQAISQRPVCVGHIDCFNEPVSLLSYRFQSWLRTSFMFLRPSEFMALQSLVSFRNRDAVFGGDPRTPFCADAPLSRNYQQYILSWLTGQDIGQGTQWHSGFHLEESTLPTFERKTLAILNEHLFSLRLRAMDVAVVDATWLATVLSGNAVEIPWRTAWRQQLAERDTDALLLPVSPAPAGARQPQSEEQAN